VRVFRAIHKTGAEDNGSEKKVDDNNSLLHTQPQETQHTDSKFAVQLRRLLESAIIAKQLNFLYLVLAVFMFLTFLPHFLSVL
jgi:hypothetical protein